MGVEKEIEQVEERGGGEGSGQRRDVKRSNFEVFFFFFFCIFIAVQKLKCRDEGV